ncbi:Alpha/Beta hydrolase protein [Aspergillus pseudoustus]|uniref:Alpha/Beta hydrolase protein n=1 Tax=Aspergillus pseudoustus TaxID=1810923 RepID=A0ABR4J0K6_9EURO
MPREDIAFKNADQITLRGWLYKPLTSISDPLPCLVMAHGFSGVKELGLPGFAEYFTAHLPIACLIYDHRGFGESDNLPTQPRQEIVPAQQVNDYSDAVTYLQTRSDIDSERIAIWGSSLSGGHVLNVAAVDRRVKAAISQVPLVDGWDNIRRLLRPDFIPAVNELFKKDRLGVFKGEVPAVLPVVSEDPGQQSALPTVKSPVAFTSLGPHANWKNFVTLKSLEAVRGYIPGSHIQDISPTPLLMVVAENDDVTPTDLALKAYEKALEPKSLHIFPGGHFDLYTLQPNFKVQADFLRRHLCLSG